MSYDISLVGEHDTPLPVDSHKEGGTYALNGSNYAELNVTYNYSKWFYQYLDEKQGIRWLYDKKAKDCIARLQSAVDQLGTEQDEDYWKDTRGNAGHALNILLGWAEEHPNGKFIGD